MKGAARENRPPLGVEKSILSFGREKISRVPEGLGKIVRSYRFALAAFLIPLFIRTIPEILVGPYPIGWDTIAFYVPTTLDWAAGKTGWVTVLGTAPLMYMLSIPAYLLTRVNPVWIFKVMGPILYGGMIWALFRFIRTGLKWPEKQALGGALLTSLYFVTLRISWDLYRNMLGLTFILLSLPLLEDWKTPRKQALLSILTVLAVASDQLTGVIALVLIGSRTLMALTKRQRTEFYEMLKIGLPGGFLFFSIAYASLAVLGNGPVRIQSPLPTFSSLASSIGFLGYAYLALTPLILLGLRSVPNFDLKTWSIFCLGIISLALLPFFGPIVESYRWSLLLDIPLCIYAAAGLAKLATMTRPSIRWVGRAQRILPIFATVLIVSAVLYIALPAERAMVYYTAFPGLLPTSMAQDTVPMSDLGNLKALLESAASRMGPQTVLITHQAIYGWARAYLSTSAHLINYGYSNPLVGVEMANSDGYSNVLLIWWINGFGWHDQPYVPNGFAPEYQLGDLALYVFRN
ncbi:hypothetical protein E6H19_02605 [Candidatus Bathyarchaeota archaeon]|nr:MAG: hypothetical protein E6H19_02605 [Candidatus Bathyarchaeota archaeon]